MILPTPLYTAATHPSPSCVINHLTISFYNTVSNLSYHQARLVTLSMCLRVFYLLVFAPTPVASPTGRSGSTPALQACVLVQGDQALIRELYTFSVVQLGRYFSVLIALSFPSLPTSFLYIYIYIYIYI